MTASGSVVRFAVLAGLLMSATVIGPRDTLLGPTGASAQPAVGGCEWEEAADMDPSGWVLITGAGFSQLQTGDQRPDLAGVPGGPVVVSNSSAFDDPEWDAIFVPPEARVASCILGGAGEEYYETIVWWPGSDAVEVWTLDLEGSFQFDYAPGFVEWTLADSYCLCDESPGDNQELAESKQQGVPADCEWHDSGAGTAAGSAKHWWGTGFDPDPERENSARQIDIATASVDLSADPYGLILDGTGPTYGFAGVTSAADRDYLRVGPSTSYALCDNWGYWTYQCGLFGLFNCTNWDLTALLVHEPNNVYQQGGITFYKTHQYLMWDENWEYIGWVHSPLTSSFQGSAWNTCTYTRYSGYTDTGSPIVCNDSDTPTGGTTTGTNGSTTGTNGTTAGTTTGPGGQTTPPDPPMDPDELFGEHTRLSDISLCIGTTAHLEPYALAYEVHWDTENGQAVAESLRDAILWVLDSYDLDGDISQTEIDEYTQTYFDYALHIGNELEYTTTDGYGTYTLNPLELAGSFSTISAPMGDYIEVPYNELSLPDLVALIKSHCDNNRHQLLGPLFQDALDVAMANAPSFDEIALERDELFRCSERNETALLMSDVVHAAQIKGLFGDNTTYLDPDEFNLNRNTNPDSDPDTAPPPTVSPNGDRVDPDLTSRRGPASKRTTPAADSNLQRQPAEQQVYAMQSDVVLQDTACPDPVTRVDVLNSNFEWIQTWTTRGAVDDPPNYNLPDTRGQDTAVIVVLDQPAWEAQVNTFTQITSAKAMSRYINENLLDGTGTQMPWSVANEFNPKGTVGVLMRNGNYAGTYWHMASAIEAIADRVATDMGLSQDWGSMYLSVAHLDSPTLANVTGFAYVWDDVIGSRLFEPRPENLAGSIMVAPADTRVEHTIRNYRTDTFHTYFGLENVIRRAMYHFVQLNELYRRTIEGPMSFPVRRYSLVDYDALPSDGDDPLHFTPSMFDGDDIYLLPGNAHHRNMLFAAYQYAAHHSSAQWTGGLFHNREQEPCMDFFNRPNCDGTSPIDGASSLRRVIVREGVIEPYSFEEYAQMIKPLS